MYISEIKIKNYRNFHDASILFRPGLNIIIGHNNAGKTNLIKALQLILDRRGATKPSIDDFCKDISDYSNPPFIEIAIFLKEHKDKPDDKNVVYDWLIQDSPCYIAQLTYVFELPSNYHEDYKKQIEECKNEGGSYIQKKCLHLISKRFFAKYISRIYGGIPSRQEKADSENLDRFDFQFLNAIRDAERQMFYGNNTLLRDVLNYFIDYDLTNGRDLGDIEEDKIQALKKREDQFNERSKELLELLIDRIDKEKILEYAKETGADKDGPPSFDAEVTERELLFALRLIVNKYNYNIPIKNNGLGYNNLLFIAFILAKMQMEASESMGDNAKVFPVLVIEEPEAHLHPSMQSKFLQFLNNNLETEEQVRQMFITTHSTHITSAVDLDSVICLYQDLHRCFRVGYPARVFSDTHDDRGSKIYVQRFLDATKSNMLFADRIIFVEGLSEQLLLPCFAEYLKLEKDLIDKHVCIISIDSRTFKHFLKLYAHSTEKPYAIQKRVVCITDADPTMKKGSRWNSVFPFELIKDADCRPLSSHVAELKDLFEKKCDNIHIFHPESGLGKTFEYEICRANPTSTLLITQCFPEKNSNYTPENYIKLIDRFDESYDVFIQDYRNIFNIKNGDGDEILKSITNCTWDETEKKKAVIAAIYYKIIENSKGEQAFYFEEKLRDNINKEQGVRQNFVVPVYLQNALKKVLE
jgi:predicted ATP-dependent endonuclease of OLD family